MDAVIAALDRLLSTVPDADLLQAQRVVQAIQEMDSEAEAEADAEAARLNALL